MKRCYRCKESKPLSEFHKDKQAKDGLSYGCKSCNVAKAKAYHAANRDQVRAADRAYWARTRDQQRDTLLRKKYGIGSEDYDRMLSEQGGGCAICGEFVLGREGRAMPVDHDHQTGRVRGILCESHNRAIGLLGDDPVLLLKAADYLMQFQDVLRPQATP